MRNDKRERIARTILAVFVAWTLLFSGIVGLGASFIALAGEEPIEPTADWDTCNSAMKLEGEIITLDGNLTLLLGCYLTVLDGGISFAQDINHTYSLNINVGATLNLTNSILTVETNQFEPYLSLPVNVDGTLIGWNAILQFPGFINVTGTIELWDSVVTGLIPPGWVSDTQGLLNDAPVFSFVSGEGQFYRTIIEQYFTTTAFARTDVSRGWMYDFNVAGASDVWFVDTYLDIDYSSNDNLHNVLQVGDGAQVYAYNMTIDTSYALPSRRGAIQATGTGVVHILRWANVLCVNNAGVLIESVSLDPLLVQTGARPNFPDSLGQTPHNYILSYLGVTAGTWLVTGPNGKAMVPLLSEYIDSSAGQGPPNSEFYGPYEVTGTYNQPPILTSAAIFSFNPYPAMDPVDGTADVTLVFDAFLLKPDLIVIDIWWFPASPDESDRITFYANIQNNGPTGANDVYVCFYVDYQPLNNTPTLISFVAGNGGIETTPIVPPDLEVVWENVVGGNRTVLVVADCTGDISESDEINNGYTETIYVVPLIPDYEIQNGYISFPAAAYIGNPVQINITVANIGEDVAPPNTVRIFIGDPTLGGAVQIGEVPISNISVNNITQAFFQYTFNEAKDYKICAWVDADYFVFEESETNNMGCNVLTVRLAPNLAVTTNDIGVGDPCTRMGQTVTPQAVVRNNGYVDAGAYMVDFYIDGDYFASGNSTGLVSNASEMISSDIQWVPSDTGIHVLSVDVDPTDAIKESTNTDNLANKDILVFHNKIAATYSGPGMVLPVDNTYHGNVDVTGSLTVNDGVSVFIQQADPLTGRYCIKVLGTGELILKSGAALTSNYPLVIYVSDSASLIVDDANIDLDVRGTGGLFADQSAVIDISSSVLNGNLFSTGNSVTLRGVDLLGVDLYIEAAETSYIWDTAFTGVQNVYLLSDDGDVNTVDFDLRNITDFIDPALDAQLVFKGNQLVELTNVITCIGPFEEWWTGMITERSKGRLFWWLTVKMVDGTGSVLQTLTPEMDLEALDEVNLVWTPVYTGLSVPNGEIVLRALSEEMQFYPTWGWTNSTYAITSKVQVAGQWFYPDTQAARGNWTGDLRTNMEVELRFSGLTPDFSVSMIAFVGEGLDTNQPLDRPLQIQATIYNSGNIASSDVEVMMYLGSELIGYVKIDVPAAGSEVAIVVWTPNTKGAKVILVHVDFNNTITERDELNNEKSAGLYVFGWPDLSVDASEIMFATDPVEQTPGGVTATVRNLGTSNAVDAVVTFEDDDGWSDTVVIPLIVVGASQDATVQWTPASEGTHNLNVSVNASNLDIYQTDYDQSDNQVNLNVLVLTLPDLYVYMVTGDNEVTVGVPYEISVTLNNSGGSTAWGVDVVLILDDVLPPVAQMTGMNITASGFLTITITCPAINDIGTHTISARVDPDRTILESVETNNTNQFTYEVVPPSAYITISSPAEEQTIKDGTSVVVEGWVKEMVTDRGIEGVELVLTLALLDGTPIGVEQYTVSKTNGQIFASFDVTDIDCEDEEGYNFVVSSNASYVVISYTGVFPEKCPYIWLTPELLLILIIIIIVVVIIAAITVYIKVFGLGKLVECGECGAFIPEDSTACPKCGVQFETETAKCSNCQAWIPVKVKKCPECGVEFATGEVEMEDYNKKMRMQYDEVKGKLKKEAQRELGKSLTHAEFEDWWKTQPTFVTFQQWLKQEEDMRKMGSKPCPSCGTLNSVTTTVCHKCGALMAGDEKPRRPPSRPPAEREPVAAVPAKKEAVTPSRPGGAQPPAEGAPPTAVRPVAKKTLPTVERPVPKKVIKKPVVEGAPTVVPKKVVRKPEEEDEESGGGY